MPDPLPLIVGVYGRKANRPMLAHLRRTNPAGILLLSRNIESAGQVRALIEEINQSLGRRLIASIDHEGGWVVRFKDGVTAFPGNAALGRAGDPALARAVGRRMAEELRTLGITLNLAPVLDVLGAKYNPGILIRSFGRDAGRCARMGAAFVRGLQDNGVWACAKHFPGKGEARKDAHYALPVIRTSRAQIARHLKPFEAAIRAGVSCVMSSHIVLPALDSQPATFSEPIIRGILRQKMGYSGVIVSDDLGMAGATTKRSVPQAAQDALKAGHDLLIVSHDKTVQARTAEALEEALDKPEARAAAQESLGRFQVLSRPRSATAEKPRGPSANQDLDLRIARRAARIARTGALRLPLKNISGPPLLILPDFTEVANLFCMENGPGGPAQFVKNLLRRVDFTLAQAPVASAAPEKLALLQNKIKQAPAVVFFCFEAMRFAGQLAALDLTGRTAPKKTVVCLIRNPWDLDLAPAAATVIDALGFRNCQLRAALEIIFGRGRLS
ncbi:MAG TPA: beta-N-acetylhexosaminidase [Elusimicrobiota bacterium]|nr:beta-N-acetylhexosaminidase [Elusimicrobiota bacterium]